MNYWLMKSEPDECSIDDLAALPNQTIAWFGVRNYQARNFMRDSMKVGDEVLFYHSSCPEPGIAGFAMVSSKPYPQFDPKSPYFDAKSSVDTPRWINVDVKFKAKTKLLSLSAMREAEQLSTMLILKPGNRLSITPVTPAEWQAIERLLDSRRKFSGK
jgi:predicted RNA-binding protein with PUA-like domain